MQIAKGIALLGTLAMGATILFGFAAGDFAKEGGDLLSMPWGIVSLVDLYVGFFLFSGWIVFRENSLTRSLFWVVLVMVLGFFTASLYTFIALHTSGGNWKQFWMGRRISFGSNDG
jgi:type IV secretory pathway VirB2 component (pilin)